MATFTDRTGDPWTVALTYAEVEDAEAAGVCLDRILADEQSLTGLLTGGMPVLARLMWICLADQAKAKGLDERGLHRRVDGPTVQRFVAALLEEAVSFFPLSPLARKVGGSVPRLIEAISREAVAKADALLSGSSPSGTPSPGTSASPPFAC